MVLFFLREYLHLALSYKRLCRPYGNGGGTVVFCKNTLPIIMSKVFFLVVTDDLGVGGFIS